MTRPKPAAALALAAAALALCFASVPGGRAGRAAAQSRQAGAADVFKEAEGTPAGFPSAFKFEVNGFSYHVGANGNGRRTKGDRTRRFNLRLDGRDFIEKLSFAVYEGDLLFVCQVGDGESGGGLVMRLEQPSMRALWKQEIPAFNVGEPLREGHSLYVTGIDFVGRLDLRTGEYIWRHDDLSGRTDAARAGTSPDDFNSFETPELAGDTVLFRERPVYNRRRTLVVNRKTGEVIRIE
ncbi:MAG TPA: hypothetical protein VFZ44_02850 [Pyrinomonadaceae bacterium]